MEHYHEGKLLNCHRYFDHAVLIRNHCDIKECWRIFGYFIKDLLCFLSVVVFVAILRIRILSLSANIDLASNRTWLFKF